MDDDNDDEKVENLDIVGAVNENDVVVVDDDDDVDDADDDDGDWQDVEIGEILGGERFCPQHQSSSSLGVRHIRRTYPCHE